MAGCALHSFWTVLLKLTIMMPLYTQHHYHTVQVFIRFRISEMVRVRLFLKAAVLKLKN